MKGNNIPKKKKEKIKDNDILVIYKMIKQKKTKKEHPNIPNHHNKKTKINRKKETNNKTLTLRGSGLLLQDSPIDDTPYKYICQYNNNFKFRMHCLCCISNNKLFHTKTIKQETTALQFFGVGAYARNANAFICANCGYMQIFDSTLNFKVDN